MVLYHSVPAPPQAEFQSTPAVTPGGLTAWISVEDGSGAGAEGHRKVLIVPSAP